MGLEELTTPFPWARYSRKLAAKIEQLRSVGLFTAEEAAARTMHLAVGNEGSLTAGNWVQIYWLVDPDDGLVVDARFQAYGQSALFGAAEAACEISVSKNYDQAKRISADLLDRHLRDRPGDPAFPKETYLHLNLVLGALERASEQCSGLPLTEAYVAPPVPTQAGEIKGDGYPGWIDLSLKRKLAVIEEVLNQDVRPYISLDGGGVEVLNLLQDKEVVIAYQGNCTSCYSSIGTTLSYIQQVLRAKVHPQLVVVPT